MSLSQFRKARPARQALPHRRAHRRASRSSRPKARTSSASASASRISTRPSTSRMPASTRSATAHALHAGRGHGRAEGRDHRQVRARQRPRLRARADPGLDAAPSRPSSTCAAPARSRRRGGHPRAVLGVVSRHGAARRRRARDPYAGAEQGYKITPAQLEAAITPKTRLVDPEQPVQSDWRRVHARRAARARRRAGEASAGRHLHRRHVRAHLLGRRAVRRASRSVCPELYDRTSRSTACRRLRDDRLAHRLCGGPVELVTAMATIQGQSTTNPSSIAQKAAVAALNGDQNCVREMNKHFKQRHDFVVAGLNKLPGVSLPRRRGHVLRVRARRKGDAASSAPRTTTRLPSIC